MSTYLDELRELYQQTKIIEKSNEEKEREEYYNIYADKIRNCIKKKIEDGIKKGDEYVNVSINNYELLGDDVLNNNIVWWKYIEENIRKIIKELGLKNVTMISRYPNNSVIYSECVYGWSDRTKEEIFKIYEIEEHN